MRGRKYTCAFQITYFETFIFTLKIDPATRVVFEQNPAINAILQGMAEIDGGNWKDGELFMQWQLI